MEPSQQRFVFTVCFRGLSMHHSVHAASAGAVFNAVDGCAIDASVQRLLTV